MVRTAHPTLAHPHRSAVCRLLTPRRVRLAHRFSMWVSTLTRARPVTILTARGKLAAARPARRRRDVNTMSDYDPGDFRISSVDITIVWLIVTVVLVVMWFV